MRHDQPTTPFDVEADELTQQFWGATKGWVSGEQPTVPRRAGRAARRDDTTGSLRAIRDGFAAFRPQTSGSATGEIRRQRHHGVPQPAPEPEVAGRREATLGELAAGRSDVGGWLDDEWLDDRWGASTARHDRIVPAPHGEPQHDESQHGESQHGETQYDEPEYEVPLSPVQPLVERLGLGAVDPLLVRGGMIALALILLVPLMLSLRPDRSDTLPGDVVEAPQPVSAATGAPSSEPASTASVDPAGTDAATAGVTTPEASGGGSTGAEAVTAEASLGTDASTTDAVAEPVDEVSTEETVGAAEVQSARFDAAAVDVAAERLVPACPQTYTAAAGDSWYRIADEAGVSPRELLAENNATTATVILPGDEICLPEGATVPSAPVAPTTTVPADEPPSTTAPSTTTAPPTTTVAPLSRAQVQELIRQTWPEEEVATALAVAERESNFVATADNGWCCVGVFQLYWTVHRSWLDDFGITERSHLYDARKNIAAAFHMWQTQGWGPWNG